MELTRAHLNRALLARQHLLERAAVPAGAMVDALVGMQAQEPQAPYPSLWSRVQGFAADDLHELLETRGAARLNVMRVTIHLLTTADALAVRAVMQPLIERFFRSSMFAKRLPGVDLAPVLELGREVYAEAPRTGPELRAVLAQRWPEHDAEALAWAVRYLVPLTQLPPRGRFDRGGVVRQALLEDWAGAPLPPADDARLVERYLRAFGPATPADVRAWSGITGVRETLDAMGDRVRVLRDETGRELFDVPDGPLPDPDVPAPVRLLGDFDNLCLGHADRSRVIPDAHDGLMRQAMGLPVVLVDGWVRASWRLKGDELTVTELDRLTQRQRAAVRAEARRYLRWARPGRRTTLVGI